jgi:hypothetical protein
MQPTMTDTAVFVASVHRSYCDISLTQVCRKCCMLMLIDIDFIFAFEPVLNAWKFTYVVHVCNCPNCRFRTA